MRNRKKLRQAVCACRGFLDITGNTCPANAAAQQIGNLAKNSVSILFVGDGFPVPLHSSLFTASPNPFGRFSRLLREAKRLPYALTNSKFVAPQRLEFPYCFAA